MTGGAGSKPRAGRTEQGRQLVRSTLTLAALDLFAARGFDTTTVDEIAHAADVGRRTFFRYFKSKDDVLFPDHTACQEKVGRTLAEASADEPPMQVVSTAAEQVMELYLAEPSISVRRFELTKQVESLRDKEIATIDHYQRLFTRFLHRRAAHEPDGALWASVAASAVVAAHNHVLREWLKSGGAHDARAMLRGALRRVRSTFSAPWSDDESRRRLVVGVVETTASADEVRRRLEEVATPWE